MISRGVKIQFIVFAVLGALFTVFVGFRYIGLPGFTRTFLVRADFRTSGGIFTNAQVLYDGVTVGRVGALRLIPGGVEVQLHVNSSWNGKIPATAQAHVDNLSAVGEQYVDLTPTSNTAPYLHGGSMIPFDSTTTPVTDDQLLGSLNTLVTSVNVNDLHTVIQELGAATNNAGPDISRLIDEGNLVTQAASDNLAPTISLLNDSQVALATQAATSGQLRDFSANLNQLSAQIASQPTDAAIRKIFDTGTQSAQTVQSLFTDIKGDLPALLANLITLGQISDARLKGVQSLLILYPGAVANGFLGASGGYAHFSVVTTKGFGPCTQGYAPAPNPPRNLILDTSPTHSGTTCTTPPGAAGGNVDSRGAAQVPRPADDRTNTPSGVVGASQNGAQSAGPATVAWDPATGSVAGASGIPDSSDAHGSLGTLPAGSSAWQWLLLGPVLGSAH